MRIGTKRMMLKVATAVAVACTAAMIFLPATAFAAAGSASASVAVRAAPTTSSARVDTLYAGERVDIVGCRNGWCYVTHSGPDGYVAARYLRRANNVTVDPNFNFSFTFGNGMLSFGIGNGGAVVTPPANDDGEVCFYRDFNYGGPALCVSEGDTYRTLQSWNDRISSIRNPDGLRVTVCTDFYFEGDCRTYTTSTRNVGDFNDEISSIRVR